MTLAKNFLLVYLLLKPFYIFSSGGLQIADGFLVLSFITLLVTLKVNVKTRREFVSILKSNKLFLLFIGAALAINALYFVYFGEFKFVLSTLYFIFNLLAILTFSAFYKDEVFLKRVSLVFKSNLILQLVIFVMGMGRYYSPDRYMGTFNDPNQFGYYIFISFLFIYVINILLAKKKKDILFLAVALFLIVQSASTGMILGVAAFVVLTTLYQLRKSLPLTYKKVRQFFYVIGILIVVSIPAYLVVSPYTIKDENRTNIIYEDDSIIGRVSEKIAKAENEADISLWEDRGYDIIFKYPAYILYGAGEGGYDRFLLATNNYKNEIHGTFPSILFYYGIIPFIILMRWFYIKIKDSDPRILIAFAALFIESFTLLNQRQSLFWMIIILGGLYSKKIIESRSV